MFRAEAAAADAIEKDPGRYAHYLVEEAGGLLEPEGPQARAHPERAARALHARALRPHLPVDARLGPGAARARPTRTRWTTAPGSSRIPAGRSALSSSGLERLKLYYSRNEGRVAAAFFAAGFVFDILTIGRIDSWFTIGQQAVYLAVIMASAADVPRAGRSRRATAGGLALTRWYYDYRNALVHFLMGTLLNLYAIFYFKSSSLLVSFGFLGFLVVVLLANELKRVKSLGPAVQVRAAEPVLPFVRRLPRADAHRLDRPGHVPRLDAGRQRAAGRRGVAHPPRRAGEISRRRDGRSWCRSAAC